MKLPYLKRQYWDYWYIAIIMMAEAIRENPRTPHLPNQSGPV